MRAARDKIYIQVDNAKKRLKTHIRDFQGSDTANDKERHRPDETTRGCVSVSHMTTNNNYNTI